MENKEGEIQAIKKDRTAIEIENIWYQSKFKEIPEEIKKGMNVRITYTINGNWNNLKSLIPLKKECKPIIITREIARQMPRESLNEIKPFEDIPIQTKNTALMSASSIIVADINQGSEFTEEELTKKIEKISGDFIKAFKKL